MNLLFFTSLVSLLLFYSQSTALIAGFYASQVLCLYRRNHRLDPKTCFYARYFQQKSRFLHRKLLCVQQAREKRNNVVPASLKYGCPFKKKQTEQKTSNNQPKNDTQRNDDFKEHHRVVNQFASLNFFDKRYEPFIKVDDYKSPYFNVSNDKPEKSQEKNVDSKVSQLSKENQQTTEQQEFVEDEAIDDILSNLSKMIGELEFKLGVECVLRGNYNEAVEHFRMSSASNNPSACFNLALLYEQGLGVKKDLRIAMELYKVASEQGHDKSQYNLGVYFARGLGGVKKNFKQAKLYFEKAAMHGNRDAIEALSMILPKKKKLSSLLVDPEDFIVSDDSGTDMVIQDSVNKHASLRRLAVT